MFKIEIITDKTAQKLKDFLASANGDITLEFNSIGGSVEAGTIIFNLIKDYTKGKIKALINTRAYSISSYIILACDEIEIRNNSIFMMHNPSISTDGTAEALRKSAEMLDTFAKISISMYVEKTNKTEDEIKEAMTKETWLIGKDIVDFGFPATLVDTDIEAPKLDKVKQCYNDECKIKQKGKDKMTEEEKKKIMQMGAESERERLNNFDLIHPEDQKNFADIIAKCKADGNCTVIDALKEIKPLRKTEAEEEKQEEQDVTAEIVKQIATGTPPKELTEAEKEAQRQLKMLEEV